MNYQKRQSCRWRHPLDSSENSIDRTPKFRTKRPNSLRDKQAKTVRKNDHAILRIAHRLVREKLGRFVRRLTTRFERQTSLEVTASRICASLVKIVLVSIKRQHEFALRFIKLSVNLAQFSSRVHSCSLRDFAKPVIAECP